MEELEIVTIGKTDYHKVPCTSSKCKRNNGQVYDPTLEGNVTRRTAIGACPLCDGNGYTLRIIFSK